MTYFQYTIIGRGPRPLMNRNSIEFCSLQRVHEVAEARIREIAAQRGALRILEAGCGRRWPIDLSGIEHHLTGVDIDDAALAIRVNEVKDLDEAIVGDIRDARIEDETFDVIYSSFVLEHIDGAKEALQNFVRWLKPGGALILKFPDRDSVYGFITRITPFWFHVWYWKYLMGDRNAGKPGFSPYPTYHDRVIARQSFRRWAEENRLHIQDELGFGGLPTYQANFAKLVAMMSLGSLTADYRNLFYVLTK